MNKIIKKENTNLDPQEYINILEDIKNHIQQSQIEALSAINVALNMRNWMIGKTITEKQTQHAWGSNFIDSLAKDLQNMYPENQGFSIANIRRMKAFYQCFQNIRAAARELQSSPIFTIPWFHNVIIIQKIKNEEEALWYAEQSHENGWSRSTEALENLKNKAGK